MLQDWLILLPELLLLAFLPVAWLVNLYRESKTAKTFFTLSRVFLAAAILCTLIFYNRSVWPDWLRNTRLTTLFKMLCYVIGLIWFYLSSKWYLNKNRSSYRFYLLCMGLLLVYGLLISSRNLLLFGLLFPIWALLTGALIYQHWDEGRMTRAVKIYAASAGLFGGLLWAGIVLLAYYAGTLSYAGLKTVPLSAGTYAGMALVTSCCLFMLAAAPFHLWFVSALEKAVLPVCGFLTLVPLFAMFSCLLTLVGGAFSAAAPMLRGLLLASAVLSFLIGALSAGGQSNFRRLFAFVSVFNIGLILFGLADFKADSVLGTFIYALIYIMSITGIYTVFLGLKSRGDYLDSLEEIGGLSAEKPYLSASALIFMFSLVGIPPLLGFWGRLALVNTLVSAERWIDMVLLLVAVIFIVSAFLRVIGTVYFEPRQKTFDRTDKAIYICLLINLVLVLIAIINPHFLFYEAQIALLGTY